VHTLISLILGYLAIIALVVIAVLFWRAISSGIGVVLLSALCISGVIYRARHPRPRGSVRR
jgi:hypothetical protein